MRDLNVAGLTWEKYRDFIGELRAIVTPKGTRVVHGLPVLNPEGKVLDRDRFVLVRLINGDTVTLAIDVVNLYIVAFSGVNNKSYFFKDATALQLKNLFVGTKQTKLSYTGNYDSLEQQLQEDKKPSKTRDKIPLGPTPLAEAITRLWYGGSVAEPLLVVIQMVSEAARFRYIEEQVRKSITGPNKTFTPKGLIVSMENKWSAMSSRIQRSKDGQHFITSVQLQDDDYKPLIINDFNTLSRYTMVAILLDESVATASSSK
ncbi:hypothetical protein TEA_008732 [Camellia sinensis var. sinensis]|uniref:rRNA N-glycosylase n=1 Tax=Camellia sinensis var. sinensis TaxID=542762 RepID=A0A4S4F1T1_CAMSN|nr:hypothetical protein TEA_008732 [Camellia sinensis var. sinensis]